MCHSPSLFMGKVSPSWRGPRVIAEIPTPSSARLSEWIIRATSEITAQCPVSLWECDAMQSTHMATDTWEWIFGIHGSPSTHADWLTLEPNLPLRPHRMKATSYPVLHAPQCNFGRIQYPVVKPRTNGLYVVSMYDLHTYQARSSCPPRTL